MTIRQLSIFLENKTGALNQLLAFLAQHHIDIVALTVADTADYGLVRLIVSDPNTAYEKLKANSFSVRMQEVVSLKLSSSPGALASVLSLFSQADISIEYVYAFNFVNHSIAVLRTNDKEKSIQLIRQHQLHTISEKELI